ncbi:hypothetical protein P8C59_008592 [Phyllachora maydis]|uniref:1-phosphatidylinositol-3-phosphate 5-kinase n=1 Tax=Phyllachora maydis TaxID=1825666 RepID=A0AAD9MER4_9PEZI|nr:hypothetical protein P8C59_008592 [Phyllachora maydis]
MRISGTTTNQGAPEMVNAKLEGMKKQILSKEFWMADDTCKECFLCGNPFSAFRRKHHCRTCGCIFDSKCTSIIPGEKFGVSGSLRVCKTCLGIINRRAVRFKKIAGGKSSDSAYVPGIVFTKNLALKSMPRKLFNGPRIVCISFAIEYQRQPRQHFMSLQPVIEQEKEYLRMVVNRIVALRPDVLLVQKSVSGVALQFLSEAQVAVAYNVKPSVIEAVSRIANTDIISSLDMLALPIRVGVSKSFEVKTFLNNDTTPPVKKTYIYITGTNEKLGCTIALRGSTTEILCRMKTITEFMVYVVYNAKLETCLLRDAYVSIPQEEVTTTKSTPNQSAPEFSAALAVKRTSDALITDEQVCDGGADGQPPPAADEMKKGASMHTSHSQISPDGQVPEDIPMPTYYSDMVDKYETRLLSVSPLVKFSQPYLLMRTREQERRLVYLRRLRDQDNLEEQGESEKAQADRFQLIKPDMIDKFGQKAHRQVMEVIHAVHDAEYDKAMHTYQTQKRQWETNIQGSLDLFNPFSHQNIVVLHSMVCTSTKIPCIEPAVVTFEFYNQYSDEYMDPDCTLGQYVEDLCQGADSVCTVNGCYTPLSNHHRTYVHDQARITVFVERGTPVPPKFQAVKEEADKDGDIIMWSFCKFCKEDFGGFPMAQSTWKYSFGKFLELSFLGRGMALHSSSGCTHDHPKDHLRYFSYRDNMVRMHWDAIDLYEIIVPRARITWKVDNDLRLKNEIFAKVEERWKRFMESVRGRIKSIKIDTSVLPEKAERCKEEVEKLSKKAQEDQPQLIRNLRNIYMNSKYYEVIPLNGVVREMLEKAAEWDAAFAAFEADFLSDKDVRLLALLQLKKFFTDNESKESIAPSETPTSVPSESVEDKIPPTTNQRSTAEADETQSLQASQQQSQLSQPTDTLTHRKPGPSGIPRYVHAATKRKESKVSTLARHFEQLSREFEKERIRDRKNRAAKVGSRAFLPRTSTKAIVEVYEDVDQAVQEPSPADDEPVGREKKPEEPNRQPATAPEDAAGQSSQASDAAQTEATHASGKTAEEAEADADADQPGESQAGSDDEGGGSDADQSSLFFDDVLSDVKEIADSLEPSGEIPEELPKHQKKSVINLLTNFWAERSASNWPSLDYPLNPSDHVFLDSDVIIREDEPSSVVAFALSSKDYQAKLASIRSQWDLPTQSMSDESDTGLEIKDSGKADALPHPRVNEKELERSLLRITGTHLKYQFFDRSAKMLCKVFYAEQFDALRQRCGVADRIIESLSRCLKWDSKGGKTKSVFLKTLDDRLVMKSLSPIETAAFLRFAPAYFSIMAEALFHDLPSVIAKMLGFFQVVIKNPDTGTEIKLDLLVMENLFYDRSPSRTFDLKGSMRNRRIQSTGEQNEVLLDENMVEYIYESPLFAREHAKRLLRASVWNDTLFLARQNVMDYSLMIAVDEAKKELVVGIIDCIRTYTWDKRLESWIKDRGFAGGGRNRPTVTSPKEYKSRFREAMARYILEVPNCWHPFPEESPGVAPGAHKTRFEGDV